MKNLIVIDHPLIKRDLSILRNKRTDNHLFRTTLRRISSVMAFQVTHDLKVRSGVVDTPLEKTKGYTLAEDIVIVPVLRAGLGLVDGFLDFLPEAKVGHVGLYRNEQTLKPVDYYSKFPRNLNKSLVLLLDPMLATGGSGAAAITFLKNKGAKRIRFVSLLAAPEGVKKVSGAHPDVKMFTAVLDRQLNSHGYILPGLGDAGDRIFGTE
ncbi:MAG: uracil phosphoribosyltransferase [Bacteroidetes bacterium]|nr:uracil phosphoribosyltransferase [Bacteroidota bacterium]MCW5896124.1 uracil phosphoribosyltransferase [Bacteroidota bacterium]